MANLCKEASIIVSLPVVDSSILVFKFSVSHAEYRVWVSCNF